MFFHKYYGPYLILINNPNIKIKRRRGSNALVSKMGRMKNEICKEGKKSKEILRSFVGSKDDYQQQSYVTIMTSLIEFYLWAY